MSGSIPRFFSQPLKYFQWAAIEKPAIFYSVVVGSMGPATFFIAPPIRRAFGDEQRPQIPLTYPLPTTPRNTDIKGYDDE